MQSMPCPGPELLAMIFVISLAVSILSTYSTRPTDMETLKAFYTSVKPWGFWEPVRDEVMKDNPGYEKNRNFLRDMQNVFMGIIWQTALVALPIFIVIKKPVPALISFVISLATSIYLKIFWYNRLPAD